MTPTELLKHEHLIILMVLGAAEYELRLIQDSGRVDAGKINQMLDFFRNFADACHHAKEEKHLFAMMHKRGVPEDTGPIAVMLQEHNEGRRRLRAVAEALPQAAEGVPSAIETVRDNLAGYIEMLRNHIDKEDNILYPYADQLLTDDDQQALSESFEKVEAEEIGAGVHEKYHQLAHALASH